MRGGFSLGSFSLGSFGPSPKFSGGIFGNPAFFPQPSEGDKKALPPDFHKLSGIASLRDRTPRSLLDDDEEENTQQLNSGMRLNLLG